MILPKYHLRERGVEWEIERFRDVEDRCRERDVERETEVEMETEVERETLTDTRDETEGGQEDPEVMEKGEMGKTDDVEIK